jgi:hypothetical protein
VAPIAGAQELSGDMNRVVEEPRSRPILRSVVLKSQASPKAGAASIVVTAAADAAVSAAAPSTTFGAAAPRQQFGARGKSSVFSRLGPVTNETLHARKRTTPASATILREDRSGTKRQRVARANTENFPSTERKIDTESGTDLLSAGEDNVDNLKSLRRQAFASMSVGI